MSFLAPLMFAFALTLPVIVVLYLLKLKRQRQEVPSTLLWLRSIQDLTANAPFQKLRNNLLLWLQLLIAALIVLALARPFLAMDQERNETKIVLIDTSASMQATDVETFDTRLDQAKAMALELVDSLGPSDRMIVATFNSRTELASLPTDNVSELRAAIRSIEPTDQPTDITDALVLVRSLVDRHPNPEVILLSDGALGTRTGALMEMIDEEGDGPPMRYIRCGTGGENVGLVAFSLSRGLSDQSRVEIFTEVLNATTRQVNTTLELSLNGERIDAKSLTLEPEQSRGVVFTNFGDVAGTLRVQLNVDDNLPADNQAFGVLSPQSDLRVLLVSERDNPFLAELLGRQDALRLSRADPDTFDAEDAAERFDLVILDNFCPPDLPEGNWMIFGAPLPIEGFEVRPETIELPPVVDWDRTSPITRFADFSFITVGEALDFTPPAYAQTLIESNQGPLVCLIERGTMSILYAGFDLYQSDWPWLVSFPIFLTNTVQHFRTRAGTTGQFTVATGEALIIPLRSDATGLTMTPPSGDEMPLEISPGTHTHFFTNTDEAGIYRMRDSEGHEITYAASLLSPAETSIVPADEIGQRGAGLIAETEVIRANTEVWLLIAWIALLVLCLEWFIYLKRTYV